MLAALGYNAAGLMGTRIVALALATVAFVAVVQAAKNLFGQKASFWTSDPLPDRSSRNLGSNCTGMLSTQKQPVSSSALMVVLLPEPERPVIMIMLRCFMVIDTT